MTFVTVRWIGPSCSSPTACNGILATSTPSPAGGLSAANTNAEPEAIRKRFWGQGTPTSTPAANSAMVAGTKVAQSPRGGAIATLYTGIHRVPRCGAHAIRYRQPDQRGYHEPGRGDAIGSGSYRSIKAIANHVRTARSGRKKPLSTMP